MTRRVHAKIMRGDAKGRRHALVVSRRQSSPEWKMSEFAGREYNYDIWSHSAGEFALFRQIAHAGEEPPDFTLPSTEGPDYTLSEYRGKQPVLVVFYRAYW